MAQPDLGEEENLTRVRAELASTKIPEVIRHVEALLSDGQKVVVFAHHRVLIDALMQRWGDTAIKIVGGMSGKQTHSAVEAFQTNDQTRVAVVSIRAGGAGLTLTAACRAVFAEYDWSPGQNSQAAARLHRIGQTCPVIVEHVVIDGSLDRILYGVNARKAKAARQTFG